MRRRRMLMMLMTTPHSYPEVEVGAVGGQDEDDDMKRR
jgi:hypothetical protein